MQTKSKRYSLQNGVVALSASLDTHSDSRIPGILQLIFLDGTFLLSTSSYVTSANLQVDSTSEIILRL